MIDVIHILEATDGGTRTHILQIMLGLDKRRFRQRLIASTDRNPLFKKDIEGLRNQGFEVTEVPMVRSVSPWKDYRAYSKLSRLLRSANHCIVHTHASKAGALGRMAAHRCGIRRVIHTPHVFYFEARRGLSRAFYRMVERKLLPYTSRLVLLTEAQRHAAITELGAGSAVTRVIPNGVDVSRFKPGDKAAARRHFGLPVEGPVIGCITRFVPQKGNDVLLRAMARVAAEFPAMRAIMVGHGPQRDETVDQAKQLGLDGKILWVEYTNTPEQVYAALDVFTLASRYEGLPYTLLDAMACAVPVVATNIPGFTEIAREGWEGIFTPIGDDAAMAKAITGMLRVPGEAARMGQRARERVTSQFPIKRFLREIGALYESEAAEEGYN